MFTETLLFPFPQVRRSLAGGEVSESLRANGEWVWLANLEEKNPTAGESLYITIVHWNVVLNLLVPMEDVDEIPCINNPL